MMPPPSPMGFGDVSANDIRATSIARFRTLAACIVDNETVIRVFAACEWDELSDDGKAWVAAIVRETIATVLEVPRANT